MAANNGKRSVSKKSKWLATSCVLAVCVLFMAAYREVFTAEGAQEVIGRLSDSFFVPGALYAGFAGLTWVSSKGGFDTFGYLFSNFSLHSLIPGAMPKKYQSFYDYKTAKDEKGRSWLPHILIEGLICMGVSLILVCVYYII